MKTLFDERPMPTTDEQAESTGSALAVIDSLTPDALFAPGGVTDAQLAAGREWYLTEAKKYGIETEERRTELKRFARTLQKLRTGIEARAKEFTGETKRKLAAIDTEKRRLVLIVGGIEADVLRPLTEWEQEEDARRTRLSGIVNMLADLGQPHLYSDTASIEAAIKELETFDVSTMQEYKVGAESAIAASLLVLKDALAQRQQVEANERELAELRRKQAERDEADRQAEAKRQEEARIAEAAEKLAAKQVADAVQAARVETRQEVIAELSVPTRPDWMEPTPEPKEYSLAQPSPLRYVPSVTVGGTAFDSRPAEPVVEETQTDRWNRVHGEITQALIGCALTRDEARGVVLAIARGLIPHVSITY
jgi:hypothetical protein